MSKCERISQERDNYLHEFFIAETRPTVAVGVVPLKGHQLHKFKDGEEVKPLEGFGQCFHCNTCSDKSIERDSRGWSVRGSCPRG